MGPAASAVLSDTPPRSCREEQVLQERVDAWGKVEQMAKENPMVGQQHSTPPSVAWPQASRLVSLAPGKSGDHDPFHPNGGQVFRGHSRGR